MIGSNNSLSDGDLLTAFAATGSESAFAQIVQRHGTMVYGICLRILINHHEAEDVTQAVFLTLAKKATSLRKEPSIGGWLHRVAWCLAHDVRKSLARRVRREERVAYEADITEGSSIERMDVRTEIDQLVNLLPDRYRLPLVLFHLESKSLEQTAQELGLNIKTASTRLVRARGLLRNKLIKRGVVGGGGALTALLSEGSEVALLPPTFVTATAKAASLVAAGKLAAGIGVGMVSPAVAALTRGAIKMILLTELKTATVITTVCLAIVGASVVVATQLNSASPVTPPRSDTPPIKVTTAPKLPVTEASQISQVMPVTTSVSSEPAVLERRLDGIIIPHWQIHEESLEKAAMKLAEAIKASDPQHGSVTIDFSPSPSLRLQLFTLLTMDSDIPQTAMQILGAMAKMSEQRITFVNNRVILTPMRPDKTTVLIPEISFEDSPVTDVIEKLQTMTGVNIRLMRAGKLPLITMSAKNIRLDFAVLTIANKATLVMGYEEDGFVLK